MTNVEFRAFLDLLMCSDPWPVGDDGGLSQEVLVRLADKESLNRNYDGWIEAYHSFGGDA